MITVGLIGDVHGELLRALQNIPNLEVEFIGVTDKDVVNRAQMVISDSEFDNSAMVVELIPRRINPFRHELSDAFDNMNKELYACFSPNHGNLSPDVAYNEKQLHTKAFCNRKNNFSTSRFKTLKRQYEMRRGRKR